MQVRELMSSPAVTVASTTKIQEIARVMREGPFSGVPVVEEDGALVGVVTELELIERNAPLREPRYLAVLDGLIPVSLDEYRHYREQVGLVLATDASELMDDDPATIGPDDSLEKLLTLMRKPEQTMVPVVEGNRVIGVVTRTDVVRVLERLEMALEEDRAAS